ncbi:hypothetical protein GJAV_G00035810 [Gymnothorax javanicus]|nr:hypothetical protein GJAV_G00035810 [Gymnothorax javanicus]
MVCSFFRRTCHTFKNLGTDPLRILPRINEALTPILYARCCTPVRESLFRKVWKGCSTKRRVSPETGWWGKVLRGHLFGVLVKS